MNPWIELVQSTTKVILHTSTDVQGHWSGKKRVIRMNPWVKLVQSTNKMILHISTEFQGQRSGSKRDIRVNVWVKFVQRTTKRSHRISLVVLWTNVTHGFTLITLLLYEKCPWTSVEMCRITLLVLRINFTHGFILITLLFRKNLLGTQWRCVEWLWRCFRSYIPLGSF